MGVLPSMRGESLVGLQVTSTAAAGAAQQQPSEPKRPDGRGGLEGGLEGVEVAELGGDGGGEVAWWAPPRWGPRWPRRARAVGVAAAVVADGAFGGIGDDGQVAREQLFERLAFERRRWPSRRYSSW
jgi:hypothetical protein